MLIRKWAKSALFATATLSCVNAQYPAPPIAPSLTATQRFEYYLHRTYSWQRLTWLAADTAIDHALGDPEWGRGPGGFGCRYASSFGRRLIGNSVEFGVGMALGQDIRFRPSRRTGLFARTRYAVGHAFVISGADGRTEPAYARYAGIATGALIAPSWRRHTLSASGFSQDLAFSSLDQVENSLLTEFTPDLQRFGKRVGKKLLGR